MNESVNVNRPEFLSLLDAFKLELQSMEENSLTIFSKINMIKTVEDFKSEPQKEIQPNSVIEELWQCIDILKRHNLKLEECKFALIRFVG